MRLGSAVSIFEVFEVLSWWTILTLVKRIEVALAGVEGQGVRGAGKPEYRNLL